MAADWARRCTCKGIQLVEPGLLEVQLGERKHAVSIEDTGDELRLSAIVARAAAVRDVDQLAFRLALRNRATPVVGFRIDARGRVVGEARVLKQGVEDEELRLVVRRTAVECDRLEFELTGKDVE